MISKVGSGFPAGSAGKESACNVETQEAWVQSLGREDPLEEELASRSSIFVRRMPWTEGPGGLQSIGSQRAGQV